MCIIFVCIEFFEFVLLFRLHLYVSMCKSFTEKMFYLYVAEEEDDEGEGDGEGEEDEDDA
jgi:hypothetical protein